MKLKLRLNKRKKVKQTLKNELNIEKLNKH